MRARSRRRVRAVRRRDGREHHGPRSLLVPTFAEELRRQARVPPRIVALGQKPRTAITLAGKGGADTVVLWEEDDGTWATSTAYAKTPWPDADDFIRAHAMKDAYGQIWTRAAAAGRLPVRRRWRRRRQPGAMGPDVPASADQPNRRAGQRIRDARGSDRRGTMRFSRTWRFICSARGGSARAPGRISWRSASRRLTTKATNTAPAATKSRTR